MSDFAVRKEPVESAVVELSENNLAIFRANGLPGAAQGDKVCLLAALNRKRNVVAARARTADELVELRQRALRRHGCRCWLDARKVVVEVRADDGQDASRDGRRQLWEAVEIEHCRLQPEVEARQREIYRLS